MKQKLFIAIIVIGFGGAAIMAYMSMQAGKSDESSSSVSITPSNQPGLTGGVAGGAPISAILPQGNKLEFDKLEEFNRTKTLFPFPKVSTPEIGTALSNLMD